MKKAYSKPEILFENFSLSTTIAAGCEAIVATPSKSQCGFDFGPYVIFLEAVGSLCTGDGRVTLNEDGDGGVDGVCYHVFSNDRNIFNS